MTEEITSSFNPNDIKAGDLPLIVLSDHSSGFIQWIIKWRTKANYNHIMIMHRPGFFASQGNVFSEVPISRYMTNQSRLKFWKIKDLSFSQKQAILTEIDIDLNLPWWKRLYDYPGIFGQALGIKTFNIPWIMYCSERVAKYIRIIFDWMPKHPSPKDINDLFKTKDCMEVHNRWSAD